MAIDRGQLLMNIIIDEHLNPESAVLLRTTEGVIGDRHLTVELVSHNRAHNSWPDVRTFSVTQKGQLPPCKLELLIVTVRGKQRAVPHSRDLELRDEALPGARTAPRDQVRGGLTRGSSH
jgi:hypothetical protein